MIPKLTVTRDFDSSNYVCSVDIWSQDGQQPQNEVKHSNTSPSVSISMASLTCYPPPPEHTNVSPYLAQQIGGQYTQYGVGGRMGYASNLDLWAYLYPPVLLTSGRVGCEPYEKSEGY